MQEMTDKDYITGLSSAVVMLTAMLADHLDKQGAMASAEFAEKLKAAADEAEGLDRDKGVSRPRYDLYLFRRVASHLESPKPRWSPEVIDGGIDPDEDD